MGSEDQLQFFLKGYIILFWRGQVEHVLTMVNLKLKPSLFTPCLSIHIVAYGVGSSFLVYPKDGHHFFSFYKGWSCVLLMVATNPPAGPL